MGEGEGHRRLHRLPFLLVNVVRHHDAAYGVLFG